MDHLTGKEAQQRLDKWWEVVRDPERPDQKVVHTIRLYRPGAFFDDLPAYQIWRQHGPDAVAAALRQLMIDAAGWSYIRGAQAAHHNGANNVRILIAPQAALDDPDSYQRFWLEVHGPFFAATCHEQVWMLSEEQVTAAGLALLEYDDNVWGAAGIMRTYYDDNNGNVVAREYYDWRLDREQALADYAHILRLLLFARRSGRRINRATLPIPFIALS